MAKITLNGYMTETQAKALKNLMGNESYMKFHLDYFGYCGNCAVTVETKNVNVTDDELRNFFDYCVRVRLVQEAAEKKPVITIQETNKPVVNDVPNTEFKRKNTGNKNSPYSRENVEKFFNAHTGERYKEAKDYFEVCVHEPSGRKGGNWPKGYLYGLGMLNRKYADIYAEIGKYHPVEAVKSVRPEHNESTAKLADMLNNHTKKSVMCRELGLSYYKLNKMIKAYKNH